MSLATIIPLALKTSIFLTVLGFALKETPADATSLFRSPGKLLRALLSMNVVMLAAASLLVAVIELHPAVKIALVALAVSPVPPMLPGKVFHARGGARYTIGLLTAAALVSIVSIPLSLELLERLFGVPMGITPGAVARVVLTTILAPLAAGIAFHAVAPAVAGSLAKPVSIIAKVLLLLGALPILITARAAMWSLIGNGTIVTLAVFVAVGLASGHLLGGPDPDERLTLAFSTACRHPGMALAIAHANFPEQKLAMAAILLYLLVSAIVTIPYQKWFHGRYPLPDAPPAVPQQPTSA